MELPAPPNTNMNLQDASALFEESEPEVGVADDTAGQQELDKPQVLECELCGDKPQQVFFMCTSPPDEPG